MKERKKEIECCNEYDQESREKSLESERVRKKAAVD